MNPTQRNNEGMAERLERAAAELPAERDDAMVSRVMHAVRSRSAPSADRGIVPHGRASWWPVAAAGAAVLVVAVVVSSLDIRATAPTAPDPLPVRLGQDLDPLLARTENDLGKEMTALSADLDRLSRMMTIRLESDTE